ncbi:ABC transporter permease subunit [Streptosporangium sp. 'caverna']|uniref:ABC transporter permease subunit n=1 Tax=Streptosporangium sp. 'caverna' TaxID=2202249 RepID=UPI000D7E285B|nr:ABC transporter permease subunit [Streptosporangium sp. 'caverna']AWS47339.1 ABC transporter permease [Streptosporangium sp. 'caverna']
MTATPKTVGMTTNETVTPKTTGVTTDDTATPETAGVTTSKTVTPKTTAVTTDDTATPKTTAVTMTDDVNTVGPKTADIHRAPAPIPFHRLLAVETRKLFDTRSGKIMTGILVALTLASVIGRGVVSGPQLHAMVGAAGIGFGTLLPVLGILTVTGEWSHRTALTTFALEPRRRRVLAAKCLPPLITAVAASLFAILVAVPVTAVVAGVQGVPATWEVDPLALLGWTGTGVLVVAEGLAVGMLLLNAPAAIVICLSTPVLWSAVSGLGATGEVLAEWFDLNTTTDALMAGDMTGGDTARLAVSTIFWIVIPMAAGVVRVTRKEVT